MLKATVSFAMSVRLSVFLHRTTRLPLDGFHIIWYLSILLKSVQKIQVSKKIGTRIKSTLNKTQNIYFIISRSILLRMRNVSDKSCIENQNTHFVFNNFFWNPCRLWDNVEKYCRAGQAKDDNMALAQSTLHTQGYNHTLRTCLLFHINNS